MMEGGRLRLDVNNFVLLQGDVVVVMCVVDVMSHVVMLGKCLEVSVKDGMEVNRRLTSVLKAEAGRARKSELECSGCGLWVFMVEALAQKGVPRMGATHYISFQQALKARQAKAG